MNRPDIYPLLFLASVSSHLSRPLEVLCYTARRVMDPLASSPSLSQTHHSLCLSILSLVDLQKASSGG